MNELVIPLARRPRPPRRVGPTVPRGLRWAMAALGRAAPDLAARTAGHLVFRPRRVERPFRERVARAEAAASWLDTPVGRVRVYRWKAGPALPWEDRRHQGRVLLVHGFGGRATQLAAFVDPLRSLGLEVVAFDAPAHGEAPGHTMDVRRLRDVVVGVAEAEGPFVGTVSHSMGAGAVLGAASPSLGRLVCIGGPYSLGAVVDVLSQALGLGRGAARAALDAEFRHRVGPRAFEEFDPSSHAETLAQLPGLVVHDVDDREVPFEQAERLASVWPGARLQPTAGLGHRRILRDPVVVSTVVDFMQEGLRDDESGSSGSQPAPGEPSSPPCWGVGVGLA
ncbi:MAG: alpha/beta fold hydrolase [Myxococcota bacterium]